MKIRFLLAIAASAALAACGSSGAPDEVVYGVAVYTQPTPADRAFPFQTYFIEPQMTVKNNGVTQPDSVAMPADVKAAIDAGMVAAGYTAAADAASADVGLKLGYGTGTVDYYYSGGWCDIYYGYYGCYYPPVYAGSYSFGLAVLGMYEQTPASPGAPFPGLWSTSIYGVVASGAGSVTYNKALLIQGIDRGFSQQPPTSSAP